MTRTAYLSPGPVIFACFLILTMGCKRKDIADDNSFREEQFSSNEKFNSPKEAYDFADSLNNVLNTPDENGVYLNEKKPQEAIQGYGRCLSIWDGINLDTVTDTDLRNNILDGIVKSYQNLALCYEELKDKQRVKELTLLCLKRQDEFEQKWDFTSNKRRGRAYRKMGDILRDEDNKTEALSYYQRAQFYFELVPLNSIGPNLADLMNEISALYVSTRKEDLIIQYAQSSINKGKEQDFQLGIPYNNLGYGLLLKKKYGQALMAFDSAYQYFSVDNSGSPMATSLHNKAMALRLLGRFGEAHATIDTAITITKRNSDSFEPLARRYSNKADIYFDQQDFSNALAWYDQSIKTFLTSYQANADAPLILDKAGLIEAYEGKAKSLAALGQFNQAMDEYDQAIALINAYKFYYADPASKINLAEITKKVFESAINTALQQKSNPAELFALSEQSKAFALLESVKKQKVLEGIDPENLEKEKLLRQKIYEIDKEFNEETDSGIKRKLLDTRQQLQDDLNQVLQVLNQNDRYRQVLSDIQPLSATEIQQKLLTDHQAMLEYFVGESQSYLFFLPKSGALQVVPLAIERDQLSAMVNQYLSGIYGPYEAGQKAPKDSLDRLYFTAASNLYNLLIPASIRPQLPQKLMVVTDDVLGYMPFGALLTTADAPIGEYRQYDYLGKKKIFSYNYSASLWQEMLAPRRHQADNKLLSFAFSDEMGQFNNQEKDLIKALGSSFIKSITDAADIKNRLEKIARRYSYLHFATHGVLSDIDPNQSFLRLVADDSNHQGQNLYLYDIYGMTLNADMVFISACDAGIGRLARGEGIMSLARGFSYAGAGSIITSLWKINQSTSNELVTHFYTELKKGMPKDEALYQAQKQYLDSASGADAAPYFWASFIPVGNMDPMKAPSTSSKRFYVLGFTLILGLVVIWGYRRRKKKTPAF